MPIENTDMVMDITSFDKYIVYAISIHINTLLLISHKLPNYVFLVNIVFVSEISLT